MFQEAQREALSWEKTVSYLYWRVGHENHSKSGELEL